MAAIIKKDDFFDPEIKKELDNINKSLKKLSDTLVKVATTGAELETQMKKNQNTYQDSQKNIEQVDDLVNDLSDSEKELIKIEKKTAEIIAKTKAEASKQNKEFERSKQVRAEQAKKIKEEIKLEKTETNSIARLRNENKKLREERDKINTSTEEGQARIKELNNLIDANNDKIKENSDSLSKQKQEIGDYSGGIKKAVSELDQMPGSLGSATQAGKGLLQTFKSILKNPIGLILTALVGTLTLVGKAFTGTRKGGLEFRKLASDLKSEWAGVKSGLAEVGDAIYDLVTGKRSLKEVNKDLLESDKINRENVESLRKLNREIIDLKDSFIDLEIAISEEVAKAETVAEVQRTIADDVTKSLKERREASLLAAKASEEAAKKQIELAQERLVIADAELKASELANKFDIDALNNRKDAYIGLLDAEKQYTLTVRENQRQRDEIRQDDYERQLDFIIDVADAQKTVNERIIADQSRSLEERKQILDVTRDLLNESFDQQLQLTSEQIGAEIDRNKLLQLNNKEIVQYLQSLGASDIVAGRILEITKERRFALQDLADAEVQLSEETRQKQIQDAENANEKIILGLKQRLLNGEISEEQFSQRLLQIQINYLQKSLVNLDLNSQEKLEIMKELADKQLELQDMVLEREEENNEKSIQLSMDRFGALTDLANNFFELGSTLNDREFQKLEEQKEAELNLVGDNADARQSIEEKFARKRRELEKKQAIQDKIQALFNAAINTAVSVTRVIWNPILAALVGAAGAVQIAAIASRPIPALKIGVKDFQGGMAVVSEEGRELVETPDHKFFLTPDKETLTYLPKGSNVYTNLETEEILSAKYQNDNIDLMIKEQKKTRLAILNQPRHNTLITSKGWRENVKKGNTIIEFIDKYFRG